MIISYNNSITIILKRWPIIHYFFTASYKVGSLQVHIYKKLQNNGVMMQT